MDRSNHLGYDADRHSGRDNSILIAWRLYKHYSLQISNKI